jgi:hypothetical protein
MLPTNMSDMFWLRGQIKEIMDSVWEAVTTSVSPSDTDTTSYKPDLIIANQLAYGQVRWAGMRLVWGSTSEGLGSTED